jgi:hypothetical protein
MAQWGTAHFSLVIILPKGRYYACSKRGVVLPMTQTPEEDGLLCTHAVHEDSGNPLHTKEEKCVHLIRKVS